MTTRPYRQFKENRLGKRIDYDKAYGYQCIDLIKQYGKAALKTRIIYISEWLWWN